MKKVIPTAELFAEFERVLKNGNTIMFTPKGESMRPFIEGGRDSVLIKRLPQVAVGDMVLAQTSSKNFVLHRIIKVNGAQLTLMGDGNLKGVEHCTTNDVLGTVIEIRSPKGKKKLLTNGLIWRHTLFARHYLLKIYRKIILKHFIK